MFPDSVPWLTQSPNWLLDSGQTQGTAPLQQSHFFIPVCFCACYFLSAAPFPASLHPAKSLKNELRQHRLWEAFPDSSLPVHFWCYRHFCVTGIASTWSPLLWALNCNIVDCLLLSPRVDYEHWVVRGCVFYHSPPRNIQHSGCHGCHSQHLLRISDLSSSWVLLFGISEAKFFLPKIYINSSPKAYYTPNCKELCKGREYGPYKDE